VPVVVPSQFVLGNDVVLFHFVARNPVFTALEENPKALLSVAGDWAFVPSHFKAIGDEDPALGIPTTYYAAVQLTGTVTFVDHPDALAALLRAQLGALQPGVEVADPADVHAARLGAIRGVSLAIEEVRAKFKFGGNVDPAHRRAVIDRLEARRGPGDLAAAAHTIRRLAASAAPADFGGDPVS
jgi:transcriptional regulator